jgi:hypothetical protein
MKGKLREEYREEKEEREEEKNRDLSFYCCNH